MKNLRFTIIVFAAVATALAFPQWFTGIGDFSFKKLIIPLLQIIMFGMGTTMAWSDFTNVIKMPKAVIVGLICQFTIMPLLGFGLAHLFSFPPEIAAGILLVGCSPSGLASNVMSYIAKANVPLSITITACATLMAPVVTPLLMRLLAGQYIAIDVVPMIFDILKIIFLPIAIGLAANRFLPVLVKKLSAVLPLVSMLGIALIMAIITASGHKALLSIGGTLIIVVLLHNIGGYFLGYWSSRLLRLPEADCRTIAIEVGLQNAGLASGLAIKMGKEATVGVAAALFATVMNATGSLLAGWWGSRQKVDEN